MLKLSKSRKKNSHDKLINSKSKLPKHAHKHDPKVPAKNHHASTFSLVSSVHHNASNCSLLDKHPPRRNKKSGAGLGGRESSASLIVKKAKNKKTDKKSKNKLNNQNHNKSTHQKSKSKPVLSTNCKSKPNISKVSPQKLASAGISRPQHKPGHKNTSEQLYERINIGLYNSKTHSQIDFSNISSMRDRENESSHINTNMNMNRKKKKDLRIDCSDQFILNQYFTNSRIRDSDQRRIQAAIKIQKVFRGFLTRKMLREYIQNEEMKLRELSRILKHGEQQQERIYHKKSFHHQERESQESISSKEGQEEENEKSHPHDHGHGQDDFDDELDISMKDGPNLNHEFVHEKKHASSLDEESSIFHDHSDSIQKYIEIGNEDHLEEFDHSISQAKHQTISQENDEIEGIEHQIHSSYRQKSQQISQEKVEQSEGRSGPRLVSYDQLKQKFSQKQKSDEELLKYTPQLSENKEEPIPTDFSEKKINQFQSLSHEFSSHQYHTTNKKVSKKAGKDQREYDEEAEISAERSSIFNNNKFFVNEGTSQKKLISLLKKQEKEKWAFIIQMLSEQMNIHKVRNDDIEKLMGEILQFSKKNKEELESSVLSIEREKSGKKFERNFRKEEQEESNSKSKRQQESSSHNVSIENTRMKKKKMLEIDIEGLDRKPLEFEGKEIIIKGDKVVKNEDMPLIRRKVSHSHSSSSNISLLEKTQQLKKFYQKNMSLYPIEEMIKIREKALEKREKDMLNKLNIDLQNSKVSHEEFLKRLGSMQEKFSEEKQLITQAKMEIFLGNRAARKLVQDSYIDARYLGFKIPFSQSYKDFKGSGEIWIKEVIVDELKQYSKSHSHKKEIKSSEDFNSNNSFHDHNSNGNSNSNDNLDDSEQKEDQVFSNSKQKSSKNNISSSNLEQQSGSVSLSHTSLMEEDISYHQYDVENQNLAGRPIFTFDESFDDSDEEITNSFHNQQKFKKVEPHCKKIEAVQGEEEPVCSIEFKVNRKMGLNYKDSEVRVGVESFRDELYHRNERTPRYVNERRPQSEVYEIPMNDSDSSSDGELLFDEKDDIPVSEISKQMIDKLIWESVSQFFQNAHFRINLSRNRIKSPNKITAVEGLRFIKFITNQIPSFNELLPKLNQKMIPTKMELLKYMRVIITDDDMNASWEDSENERSEQVKSEGDEQGSNLEEIGRYELFLQPEVCLVALEKYLRQEKLIENHSIQGAGNEPDEYEIRRKLTNKVSEDCLRKVISREKLAIFNESQRLDLRHEIKKIEMHCIFDAFNQLMMQLRTKVIGYSGIGLNELTSLFNKETVKDITDEKQLKKLLQQSEAGLKELLHPNKTSAEKLQVENYEEICRNDSLWINYSDQALSFAMEFVFMLQDQIWCLEAAEIGHLLKIDGFE